METKQKSKPKFRPNPDLKLMDQVKEVLRYYHYAYRTETTYCQWILRYIHFYGGKTHPKELDAGHIERFLSHLAVKGNVAASTQHQALNALIFLYRNVLDIQLDAEIAPTKSKRKKRPPVVFTSDEVSRLFRNMKGTHLLMAKLIYSSGLRLMECIRLRIHDIDFGQKKIYVRGGKGAKDRVTVFLPNIAPELHLHIEKVVALHHKDLKDGYGKVYLPHALDRKYTQAAKETGWQYIFPAKKRSIDPRSGKERRHHVLESGLQKAVKTAIRQTAIRKQAGCHTLRHYAELRTMPSELNLSLSMSELFMINSA